MLMTCVVPELREILVRSALGSDRIDDLILDLAAELRAGRS